MPSFNDNHPECGKNEVFLRNVPQSVLRNYMKKQFGSEVRAGKVAYSGNGEKKDNGDVPVFLSLEAWHKLIPPQV